MGSANLMCVSPNVPTAPTPPTIPAAPPPPPTAVDPAVLAARQNARDRSALAGGRASTIATSAIPDDATSTKKQLLGS